MSWIQTFTGRKFFPLAPRAEDIDVRDIAHSLSMQCRFNGHCRTFYSVAQHSVLVSSILPAELTLWGLLHDAAEAYLSDLPRPIKTQLPSFQEAEDRLLRIIAARFKLIWPMPEAVKRADDTLLVSECRDLMSPMPEPWCIQAQPLAEKIEPVSARQAEEMFLARFREVGGAID